MKMIGFVLVVGLSVRGSVADESRDEFTPLKKNVESIRATLEQLQTPFAEATQKQLERAIDQRDGDGIDAALKEAVCLKITINPEGRVRVARGESVPVLKRGQPAYALLRIENQSGGQPKLSPKGDYTGEANPFQLEIVASDRFDAELKGELIEYRLLKIVCQETGKRELTVSFHAGQGTQDLGFRGEVPILFDVTEK